MSGSNQRGLSAKQIAAMINDHELMALLQHPKLFLGIRNGYFNLYFHGASVGRFSFPNTGGLKIETHHKYLGTGGKGYQTIPRDEFFRRLDGILESILRTHQESGKGWEEKTAQQALLMANNRNPNSGWYCVDMEYIQQRQSGREPCYGRFDIVALSRAPDAEGRHRVALIELKVGSTSYKSALSKEIRGQIEDGTFFIDRCETGLGSGIVGHLADFYRFEKAGQFRQLREEICQILSNKRDLGFPVPCAGIQPGEIADRPYFYILTLCRDISSCKETMYRYLGIDRYTRLSKYNARKVIGRTFLDCGNYRFLFAPQNFSDAPLVDILGDASIEALRHSSENSLQKT